MKKSRSDLLAKVMIANLLPTDATHSSLELFGKQALLLTFG